MSTEIDAIRARWAPVAPSDGSVADDLRRSMEFVTRTMNYHHAPDDVATLLAEVERLEAELLGPCAHEPIVRHERARAERAEAERDAALAKCAGLVAGVEARADEWREWSRKRSTPRIDAFRDAADELRALLATHATSEADQ